MKANKKTLDDELRSEYDFDYSKAIRGKYCKQLLDQGTKIVILEPDLAKIFGNSSAVNEALRLLLDLTRSTQRLTNKGLVSSRGTRDRK